MKKILLISIFLIFQNCNGIIKSLIYGTKRSISNVINFDTLIKDKKTLPQDIFNAEINFPGIVVVKWFVLWCGPCNRYAPIFESFAIEVKDEIKIGDKKIAVKYIAINVDNHEDVAGICKIKPIPDTHFYSKGKLIESVKGSQSKEFLVKKIHEIAGKIQ